MDSHSTVAYDTLSGLETESLERRIQFLVSAYQSTRVSLLAWLVVSYAQVLSRHPDCEVSEEQRCVYRRLALQWRLLARSGEVGRTAPRCDFAQGV